MAYQNPQMQGQPIQQAQPIQQGQPGPGEDPMSMLQNNPELMARLEGMAPQDREQFMRQLFQDYQGQQGVISDEQAKAEALRGAQGPEGIQTARGGYVAGNPLGHLAAGIQQGMGNYQAKEAMAAKKALSEEMTGGLTTMADLLRTS